MEIRSVNPLPVPATASGTAENRAPVPPATNVNAKAGVEAQSAPQNAAARPVEPSEVEESVKKVNEAVKLFNNSVQFSVDEDTKRQVIKVVDLDTKEVIRQIPSEDLLAIARAFDKLQGLLIKDKA